jgi:hypothetical protein
MGAGLGGQVGVNLFQSPRSIQIYAGFYFSGAGIGAGVSAGWGATLLGLATQAGLTNGLAITADCVPATIVMTPFAQLMLTHSEEGGGGSVSLTEALGWGITTGKYCGAAIQFSLPGK